MPVAIRSLNGYYGFLDSLRSLEMTTVTEQIPIYRVVGSRHNPMPPLPKGGKAAKGCQGGYITKFCIPQSPTVTAPFRQGGLFLTLPLLQLLPLLLPLPREVRQQRKLRLRHPQRA